MVGLLTLSSPITTLIKIYLLPIFLPLVNILRYFQLGVTLIVLFTNLNRKDQTGILSEL